MRRPNGKARGTPICLFSSHECRLALFFSLWLTVSPVRGQQSYIPWSTGPATGPDAPSLGDFRSDTVRGMALGRGKGGEYFASAALETTQSTVPPLPPLPPASAPNIVSLPDGVSGAFADSGPQTDESFSTRLFKAYFGPKDEGEEEEASHRPGAEVPFESPPFPFADHIGPMIGYRDTTEWPLMDAIYHGPYQDWWKKNRIKIYGWAEPSVNFSTSRNSNIPLSYSIVPNQVVLSQGVVIFERVTDSVQTENYDWGFKFTNLYGIDYRFTTAKGWFSDQLLKHNRLYGYDPLQLYVDFYIPWIRQGTIVRAGRFISPMDIEAQLAPDNYIYTHSLMNTYDPFTLTGIQFMTRLGSQWHVQGGVHAGGDMAPWTTSSQPNGMLMLRWVSKTANDSRFWRC